MNSLLFVTENQKGTMAMLFLSTVNNGKKKNRLEEFIGA